MLSDARSLWSSFSDAASTLNENINIAFEKIDKERSGHENDHSAEELCIYKKLLDDAQMYHVELSQASRLLVAERDAELKYWKKKSGADDTSPEEKNDDVDKIVLENKALQETLVLLGKG
jgi:hypothetical protein